MSDYSVVTLPDGAKLAYEVLGQQHIGHTTPLVFVIGTTCRRIDWERLSTVLAQNRPILVFDHRGIGDSTYSPPKNDDEITIESYARDLLFLLNSLGWKEIAICGYSLGGAVVQQLLVLPYHPTHPTPLSFQVTHALLTATLPTVLRDKRWGLKIADVPPGPVSDAEKRELLRPTVESLFDSEWVGNPANKARLQWWMDRYMDKRPMQTILKQKRAMAHINFADLLGQIPRATRILVIHGKTDGVVPFSSGQEILQRIPWAEMVSVGDRPGNVPSYNFGHCWWEHFNVQVWKDVVEVFLQTRVTKSLL